MFVLLAVLVDELLDLPLLLPEGSNLAVGVPVIAAGILITAWSALHFLRSKGTPVPFNPPPTLVATGPYRLVRNPMLTGVSLLLFGVGFAIRSVSLVLVVAPLYVLINAWELKRIEEPELARRLGDECLAYLQRTPMFVPGLWRRHRG